MQILVVEDDDAINAMICTYIQDEHHICTSAYSGSEAKLRLSMMAYDLVILDLMLPGLCGEELLKQIRTETNTHVIVVSAKDDIESRVQLLEAGADDYLCKPFDLKELKARVQVQLRTSTSSKQHKVFQDLYLSDDLHTMQINSMDISLTPHEYRIMELLITHPQRAFTRKDIYEYAWEDTYYGDDKTINVHISNLRSKIATVCEKEYIQTIWGIGFKIKS